ncbi:MAG: TIGR03087 family PEP-CTERM/XrtA system glycosyltransferase [Parvularculaceae bacterium]|nr:TIGR03087 family PEP-CTERM/XrtA system glycosyltransferase [Parvularculaceae bacterium]
MTARREVLFLAHRIPYPPDKGDKIRSWRILEALARRFDVRLAAFVDDPDDFQHTAHLQSVCACVSLVPLDPRVARLRSLVGLARGEALTFPYYRDRRMESAVRSARARPLAAEVAFSSSMAPYLAEHAGRPRIVDFCDADSEKWRQYAEDATGPMRAVYAREAQRLRKAERAITAWAEASFAVSPAEAAVFHCAENRAVDWFGNGVDAAYFDPAAAGPPPAAASDVVFVGAMDYRANVKAALWFADKVWPLVRAGAPEATFALVGSKPVEAVRALAARQGISVTGRVDDVRPYLASARVVVAPLQVARGVQNKVLEALAMARPLVATRDAATGVDIEDGVHYLAADDPAAFAAQILELLKDRSGAEQMGERGRLRMIERHSWAAQLARFEAALDRLIA